MESRGVGTGWDAGSAFVATALPFAMETAFAIKARAVSIPKHSSMPQAREAAARAAGRPWVGGCIRHKPC